MPKKPTYEELEKKLKVLKDELSTREKIGNELERNIQCYNEEINRIPVGFFRFSPSPDERFIMGNPAIIKMFGFKTLEEFFKVPILDLYWDPKDYFSFSKKLNKQGEVVAEEIRLKTLGGDLIWGAITANAVLNESGDVNYYYGIVEDITERKNVEELLIQEKAFSETVIESMPGLFFMLDEDYHYVKWNRNAAKIYGYDFEEMVHFGVNDGVVAAEDVPAIVESFERAKRGDSGYAEYTIISKDGRKIPLAGEASHIEIDGKDYLVGMEININQRKKAEQKLKKTLNELRELKNRLEAENIYLKEQINYEQEFGEILGESDQLKYVLFKAKQVASTDATVLILGETGVGKNMLAHTIHDLSLLKDRTMVKVSCASLPPSLIENELFGHEKGAFTGANERKFGRFEIANGSTIFLDEISELPLDVQAKLLQVVEEGQMMRLGGTRSIKVNVRIIVATNRDLEEEVRKGCFREDLWYRLNVYPITIPPLRDRKKDIPVLVNFFVNQLSTKMGKTINKIPQTTMDTFIKYPWPGNVRELRNVIERAVIETSGSVLQLTDKLNLSVIENHENDSDKSLLEKERDYILHALEKKKWRVSGPKGAANILGLRESTLRARMKKLGISRSEQKT